MQTFDDHCRYRLCLETMYMLRIIWKLYICCAAATPVFGIRFASDLHPGTPKAVQVFFASLPSRLVSMHRRLSKFVVQRFLPSRWMLEQFFGMRSELDAIPFFRRSSFSVVSNERVHFQAVDVSKTGVSNALFPVCNLQGLSCCMYHASQDSVSFVAWSESPCLSRQ